jgi:hypothetical protein
LDKERIKAQGGKTTDGVTDAEKQDGKMFDVRGKKIDAVPGVPGKLS